MSKPAQPQPDLQPAGSRFHCTVRWFALLGLLLAAMFIAYTFFIEPIPKIAAGIKSRFDASNFYSVLNAFAKFLGMEEERLLLSSELAARIQVFIAFAYTYHYLN